MYREPADRPAPEPPPPSELVYIAVDREKHQKPSLAVMQLVSLPLVAGTVASLVATPTVGLVALIATGVGAVVWWKRAPFAAGLVLRVKDGELTVATAGGKKEKARLPLGDLVDVALDTKTIQRVQDGPSAIPAMRFIDSRVAPEVDTSRIVLAVRDGRVIPLSDAYLANMDATEWLGRIRVFLRKKGWLPEDERDDGEPSQRGQGGPASA